MIVLKGVPIDIVQIHQDFYAVGMLQNRIVPWNSPRRIMKFVGGPVRFALGGSGHIAGVINPPSKGRGYWINDKPVENADQWYESAERREGSWWIDWLEWLKPHSGKQVVPPSMG